VVGGLEIVIFVAILLLLFGAKRIPQLARSLGIGARELRKGFSEVSEDKGEEARTPGESGELTHSDEEQQPPSAHGLTADGGSEEER
jgi:sec-independent protein translocase protein TatA